MGVVARRNPYLELSKPFAQRAAGALIKYGPKLYNVAKRVYGNKNRKTATEQSVITTQYDAALRYKRKRMPRRKRRAWVAFVKKTQAVDLKAQSLISKVIAFPTRTSWAANQQATVGWTIYPIQMGSAAQDRDLLEMFIDTYGGVTVADQSSRKLYFKSACIDIQMQNSGSASCIIDAYVVVMKTNFQVANDSIASIWNKTFSEQNTGAITNSNPALTPFQNPNFCRVFKVLSKKEVLLGAGQVTTMQLRDPKQHLVSGRQLIAEVTGIPYLTRGFVFQIRGVPGGGATPELSAGSVNFGIQKTYNYAVPPGNQQDAID